MEHLRDIIHVPEFDRLEIQHFFEVYKDLEPGKSVEGATWVGRVEAEEEIRRSYAREIEHLAAEHAERPEDGARASASAAQSSAGTDQRGLGAAGVRHQAERQIEEIRTCAPVCGASIISPPPM